MDRLMEVAREYTKLFGKDYIYTLETDVIFRVSFMPMFFHHLMGLQKLKDVPQVLKSSKNRPAYIFRNIIGGQITLDDIGKSRFFDEIEPRLRHFSQINRLIEFEKVIVNFDPSLLVRTRVVNADYVLFKKSNDNMFLNLFLKSDGQDKQIPMTFLPHLTDYYTYGQKVVKIISLTEIPHKNKRVKLW